MFFLHYLNLSGVKFSTFHEIYIVSLARFESQELNFDFNETYNVPLAAFAQSGAIFYFLLVLYVSLIVYQSISS